MPDPVQVSPAPTKLSRGQAERLVFLSDRQRERGLGPEESIEYRNLLRLWAAMHAAEEVAIRTMQDDHR